MSWDPTATHTTGDDVLDLIIDDLTRPGTTQVERDRMREKYAAGLMRNRPSRLVPLEAS